MNKLNMAMRAVHDRSAAAISLESLGHSADGEITSLESLFSEMDQLGQLAENLHETIVTMESFDDITPAQANRFRAMAIGHLRTAGADEAFITETVPSLEAEGDPKKDGLWQRFKQFIKALWSKIMEFLKNAYHFFKQAMVRLTIEEKTAFIKLRHIKDELTKVRNGLTIYKTIDVAPRHFNIFSNSAGEGTYNFSEVLSELKAYSTQREKIDNKLPQELTELCDALIKISAKLDRSVESGKIETVRDIFASSELENVALLTGGESLVKALGGEDGLIPLMWDRAIEVKARGASSADIFTESGGPSAYQVIQIDRPALTESKFEAFSAEQVGQLLKIAEQLLDQGLQSKHRSKWETGAQQGMIVQKVTEKIVNKTMKSEGLEDEVRDGLKLFLSWVRNTGRLCTLPFITLTSIQLRVVSSALALANDQVKNLEESDGAQKRHDDKKKLEEERERAAQAKRTKK